MKDAGLRRNRDFQLMSAARGLSMLGTQVSAIAFPLLVLRLTRSPADAGLVGFAEGVAVAATLLPGGAIADRWNRRAVMLVSDIGCLVTMALLCAAILTRHAAAAVIVTAAVLVAALGAAFGPAAGAAMRLIVSDADMGAAISVNQARNAAIVLAGPALGGLLFEISPSLPFSVDLASYGVSLAGTLAIRTRLAAPPRTGPAAPLLSEVLAGVAFVWRRRMLRVTLLNAAVLNSVFTGVVLGLIVTAVRAGATGLTTGSVVAVVSLGSLAGSLLAPAVSRRLSLRQALVAVTWTCVVMVAGMALTRSLVLLGILAGTCALLVPALNVMVGTAQALATPDALQGRVQSAIQFVALAVTPLGTVTAGFLLDRWSPAVAFLVFAGAFAILAVVNTASRALRDPTAAPAPAAPVPSPAESG
jgi:MFS family permease